MTEQAEAHVFSVSEAAQAVGYTTDTVRRWCRTGSLPAFRTGFGGNYRISRSELARFWRERGGGDLLEAATVKASGVIG